MDFQQRAERLRQHPDTVTVEIAGQPMEWFLGKLTFDLARKQGLEFGEVLAGLETFDESAGIGDLEKMMDAFGKLLYFGMLPFDEALTEADVTDFLSVPDLMRLMPQLMEKLGDAAEGEAGKAQAAAAQKAQSAADRRRR